MDYTVHGITKSWPRLSDFHFGFTFMDIVRPRAKQLLSLVVATGKLRVNMCSISHKRTMAQHSLPLFPLLH